MMKGCGNMKLGDYIFEYSQRNKEDKNYPVYSVTNTLGFCQEYFSKDVSGKDKTTYKLVPRGYFAYNPSRINVGSVDWQKSEDCVIVSPLYVVFGLKDTLKPEYLKYYLKSKPTNELIKLSTSGTVRDNLKYSSLEKFPIPVPSIEEQKAICSLLDKINRVIEAKKEQLKELDNLAQAIFYDMFGDPVTNENGWEVKQLGEECTELRYGTSRPACENGQYKYLRMGNLTTSGYLDLTNLKTIDIPDCEVDKCMVKYGDVLFNRTNSLDLIGKTCMFDLEEPMIIAGYIIRVRLSDRLTPRYVSVAFNMPSMKKLLRKMAKGAVNQANINSKELSSIRIPIPPLPLQQAFAEKVEALERQKELINQSLREVQTLFDSRMDYWFSEEDDDFGQLDKLD